MRTNRKAADLSAPPRVCPKGSVTGNESATSAPVSVLPCSSFLVLMTPSSHPQIPRACWAASSLPGGRGKCVSLPSQLALVIIQAFACWRKFNGKKEPMQSAYCFVSHLNFVASPISVSTGEDRTFWRCESGNIAQMQSICPAVGKALDSVPPN